MIFSIAMGADYSFCVKTIETHARTFLPLNISAIGTVMDVVVFRLLDYKGIGLLRKQLSDIIS